MQTQDNTYSTFFDQFKSLEALDLLQRNFSALEAFSIRRVSLEERSLLMLIKAQVQARIDLLRAADPPGGILAGHQPLESPGAPSPR